MDASEFNIRIVALKSRIYRLARVMLGDIAEAEDATQDIYEKLWRGRDNLDKYDNVEAMVYTSARNYCTDKIRRRKVSDQRVKPIETALTYVTEDGSKIIEISDMKRAVEREIENLPPKQQSVIHLRDIEGCEIEEIARITDMDEATVRVNLSRARKTVKERMIKIMNHGL